MNGYQAALQESGGCDQSAGDGRSVKTYRFASVFVPSLAPPYPSIEDELRKDVAVLAKSLDIRDRYIDDLRETKDLLASELRIRDIRIEDLGSRIKRYQQLFRETNGQEKEQ